VAWRQTAIDVLDDVCQKIDAFNETFLVWSPAHQELEERASKARLHVQSFLDKTRGHTYKVRQFYAKNASPGAFLKAAATARGCLSPRLWSDAHEMYETENRIELTNLITQMHSLCIQTLKDQRALTTAGNSHHDTMGMYS
jgi:hypothetical protein